MEDGNAGSNFHKLLGRGLTDYEFREALMDQAQQAQALKLMGIEPTEAVLEALNAAIRRSIIWRSRRRSEVVRRRSARADVANDATMGQCAAPHTRA